MTIKRAAAVVLIAAAGQLSAAAAVNAQTATPAGAVSTVLTGDARRDAELRAWMDEFTDWQRWWVEFANRNEPGVITSSRPRRVRPAPPEWLAERCAEVISPEDTMAAPCALLEDWRSDNATITMRAASAAALHQREAAPKTMWWEYVHVDLLWPATELRHSVYGVVGMHTATSVKGRMQIFLAPGVMLMNLPSLDGHRIWKVAANYGLGFRLFDFTFPGQRRASLHVNIAKSWLMTDVKDVLASRSTDFAGFSISFKRR